MIQHNCRNKIIGGRHSSRYPEIITAIYKETFSIEIKATWNFYCSTDTQSSHKCMIMNQQKLLLKYTIYLMAGSVHFLLGRTSDYGSTVIKSTSFNQRNEHKSQTKWEEEQPSQQSARQHEMNLDRPSSPQTTQVPVIMLYLVACWEWPPDTEGYLSQ